MSVATGALVLGAAAAGGVAAGAMSGGTNAQVPNAGQTAGEVLQDQINMAPSVYDTTAAYDPQYADLQNQILSNTVLGDSSQSGLINLYQQSAPQLQSIQSGLNAQQAGANIGLVNQYASSAIQTYQNANPQLQQLQNQLTGMATTQQNPVSQLSGAGSWGNPYAQQVQSQVSQNAVNPLSINSSAGMLSGYNANAQNVRAASLGPNATGTNATNAAIQQQAQQQLALGSSMSQQQQNTVANSVLSNYNQMGRANDPTAIAALATGEDTYGQQLLQQRESNAQSAANLQTGQQTLGLNAATTQAGLNQSASLANQQAQLTGSGLNLSALTTGANLSQNASLANQSTNLSGQQTNLSALLQGLGLQGTALSTAGQQQLAQGQSNQQAQLSNAQYQSNLLTTAANLAQSSAINPYSLILGQSGALGTAQNTVTQAGQSAQAGNSLSTMYNPFNSSAYSQLFGTEASASAQNAQTNAGLEEFGLSSLFGFGSAAGGAG